MKLILNGTDDSFDVVALSNLFFPRDGFTEEKGKILTITRKDDSFEAVFAWKSVLYRSIHKIDPALHDGERCAIKRAAYDVFSEATGIQSPWGILSGVRPIRFYETLTGIYGERTDSVLEKSYLVTPEKIDLCKKTLLGQKKAKEENRPGDAGMYLSIPFCPSRCKYCSFVSQVTQDENKFIPEYLAVLKEEIAAKIALAKEKGHRITTLYIGGGTPTTLSANQMKDLMETMAKHLDISSLLEYTVEAGRPDTITEEKLRVIEALGATRISVNPQTLSDSILQAVGRKHTAEDFYRAYEAARKTNLAVNVDLIAGLPGDTPEQFEDTMEKITALDPHNVTVHTLYLKRAADFGEEDPAEFTKNAKNAVKMVEISQAYCRERGYFPYYLYRQKNTVGNLENVGYAKPGYESPYNIYMMDDLQPIYGAGANATTKFIENGKTSRVCNTKFAYNYITEKWK
ncbi:MAG: coproporphyrinogen dehydrogenase HemZ [Clostridia bacterium]|nr:coproporphyrinogen dehydrogenase HemZ [Clostridia bacterium]